VTEITFCKIRLPTSEIQHFHCVCQLLSGRKERLQKFGLTPEWEKKSTDVTIEMGITFSAGYHQSLQLARFYHFLFGCMILKYFFLSLFTEICWPVLFCKRTDTINYEV